MGWAVARSPGAPSGWPSRASILVRFRTCVPRTLPGLSPGAGVVLGKVREGGNGGAQESRGQAGTRFWEMSAVRVTGLGSWAVGGDPMWLVLV